MVKNWWQSKTLWLNAIAMAIAITQALQGQAWVNPEYQILALAILNAILRFMTSQPIV